MDQISGNDAFPQPSDVAVFLNQVKRAVFALLEQTVNRCKPTQVPRVAEDYRTHADQNGEFRWKKEGWTIHLFLEPFEPIQIRWGCPKGRIFDINKDGVERFAQSIDDPWVYGWPHDREGRMP